MHLYMHVRARRHTPHACAQAIHTCTYTHVCTYTHTCTCTHALALPTSSFSSVHRTVKPTPYILQVLLAMAAEDLLQVEDSCSLHHGNAHRTTCLHPLCWMPCALCSVPSCAVHMYTPCVYRLPLTVCTCRVARVWPSLAGKWGSSRLAVRRHLQHWVHGAGAVSRPPAARWHLRPRVYRAAITRPG